MKHSIPTALLLRETALAKRLASLVSTRNFLRAIRSVSPALITVAYAGLAHAQGTMDFSGATTVMSTFNVSSSAIQEKIVCADLPKIVAKQTMCAFQRQVAGLCDFQDRLQGWVPVRARKVGKQVPCCCLKPLSRPQGVLIRGLDPSEQFANLYQGSRDVTVGNMFVHCRASPSGDSTLQLLLGRQGKLTYRSAPGSSPFINRGVKLRSNPPQRAPCAYRCTEDKRRLTLVLQTDPVLYPGPFIGEADKDRSGRGIQLPSLSSRP